MEGRKRCCSLKFGVVLRSDYGEKRLPEQSSHEDCLHFPGPSTSYERSRTLAQQSRRAQAAGGNPLRARAILNSHCFEDSLSLVVTEQ